MKSKWIAAAALLAAARYAQAQPPVSQEQRTVAVTASLRSRVYAWDWFEPANGTNLYAYPADLLRVNFSVTHRKWDFDTELALPILLGLPSAATAPAPQGALGLGSNYYTANGARNAAMLFPKQLYVRLHGVGARTGSLRLGRFEFGDGAELVSPNATLATLKRLRIADRLLGSFGWSDTGRSYDGLHYSVGQKSAVFTFVAATPTRGAFQVDGWGWNRVGIAYASETVLWGRGRHSADTRLFALEYEDWRQALKTDNRAAAARAADLGRIRIDTFGGHSIHAFAAGPGAIDVVLWGAVQTGRWGAQLHRARAFDLEAGFQPKLLPRLKPWLRAGFYSGSGDRNAKDATHGTFFPVLPTPRPYARFPFFNESNIDDRFGALIVRPHRKLTVSSEFHSLRLDQAGDLWYSGGGVFQPWTFGYSGRPVSGRRSLANLYDTQLEYRVTRRLTLTGYTGYAQGLAAIESIYPAGKDGRFAYLEVLVKLFGVN